MDYIDWQKPIIDTFKTSARPGLGVWALVIIVASSLLRFFARDITWPSRATWGAQVEATEFYARQTAVEDISFAFLLFGLSLLLYSVIVGSGKPSHPIPKG